MENINKKRYWLRGGIMGVVISLLWIIAIQFDPFPGGIMCVDPAPGGDYNNPFFGCKTDFARAISVRPIIFLWPPFISSFLGWLYGKIKKQSN